jgi:hypothetical protein
MTDEVDEYFGKLPADNAKTNLSVELLKDSAKITESEFEEEGHDHTAQELVSLYQIRKQKRSSSFCSNMVKKILLFLWYGTFPILFVTLTPRFSIFALSFCSWLYWKNYPRDPHSELTSESYASVAFYLSLLSTSMLIGVKNFC